VALAGTQAAASPQPVSRELAAPVAHGRESDSRKETGQQRPAEVEHHLAQTIQLGASSLNVISFARWTPKQEYRVCRSDRRSTAIAQRFVERGMNPQPLETSL